MRMSLPFVVLTRTPIGQVQNLLRKNLKKSEKMSAIGNGCLIGAGPQKMSWCVDRFKADELLRLFHGGHNKVCPFANALGPSLCNGLQQRIKAYTIHAVHVLHAKK